ncbi:MAG: hypothetical protein IH881_18795 [Myxococcales bacterium]|nr:hypothetical protein [Myxococcales bacterium]
MFHTNFRNRSAVRRFEFALLSAILVISLGWGSVAQARTETARWTHADTGLAGFRIYSSTSPGATGSLVEDLTLAEAGPNQAGEYFTTLTIADEATVYITVTAYDDDNVESYRSNEKTFAPPPPPDRDNDGTPDDSDAFPDDPNESVDTDADGVGDNADAFPNDSSEWADSDGDGYGDNSDAFPNDSTEWLDSDGDGYGDNVDVYPNDPTLHEEIPVLSPYRVNAGGSEDLELSDGRTWTRDMGFWNTGTANVIDSSIDIAATTFDEMYRSGRTDPASGEEMMWSFPLTNGSYTLRLYFAEHTYTAAGQRFFDIEVEDVLVLGDFDIFAEAGNTQYRAVVKSFTVAVTDGVLEVRFVHRPGGSDPTVMGIEVVSNDAAEGPLLTTPGKPFLIDTN